MKTKTSKNKNQHQQKKFQPKSDAQPKRLTTASGEYVVDNLSTLKEYLAHKPHLILSIVCSAENAKEIQKLDNIGFDFSKIQVSNSIKLQAVVRHQSLRIKEFFEQKNQSSFVLALDHITDPHNLGAIVRSAAFFGVTHIFATNKRQALLSDVSVNVARGGFAHCSLVLEPNLAEALAKLKSEGYWIVGADMSGETLSRSHTQLQPTCMVLGSEHSGLSELVRKKCQLLVKIPGLTSLDSLNVSASAAILCAAWQSPVS